MYALPSLKQQKENINQTIDLKRHIMSLLPLGVSEIAATQKMLEMLDHGS